MFRGRQIKTYLEWSNRILRGHSRDVVGNQYLVTGIELAFDLMFLSINILLSWQNFFVAVLPDIIHPNFDFTMYRFL